MDPATDKISPGDIQHETRLVLNNIKRILEGGGASLADVVRVGVYLTDGADFARMNEVYTEFFGETNPPGPHRLQIHGGHQSRNRLRSLQAVMAGTGLTRYADAKLNLSWIRLVRASLHRVTPVHSGKRLSHISC